MAHASPAAGGTVPVSTSLEISQHIWGHLQELLLALQMLRLPKGQLVMNSKYCRL